MDAISLRAYLAKGYSGCKEVRCWDMMPILHAGWRYHRFK